MRIAACLLGLLLMLGAHADPTCAQQTDSTYTVQSGDTLYSIAQKVGASVRSLMRWNDLDDPSIQVGQTLRVRPPADPSRSASSADADSTAPPSDSSAVGTADTAASDPTAADTSMAAAPDTIAADTGKTAADDTTASDTTASDTTASDTTASDTTASDTTASDTSTVAVADTTDPDTSTTTAADSAASDTGAVTPADTDPAVAPSDTAADAPRPYGRYTVRSGDTFVTLALRLGTSVDSLLALNDSTTTALAPDSTLRIPRRFSPLRHVVQTGHTLYSIAGEYGVSVRSLRAANDNLNPDSLQPGQRLRIPGRRGKEIPPPGTWATPDTTGRVARYPEAFAGRLTASGTAYDPSDLVISHPSLPFDSVVLLATPNDERQTFARVIDRGPIEEGTLLDVSEAVAEELALSTDTPSVSLRLVWKNRDAN